MNRLLNELQKMKRLSEHKQFSDEGLMEEGWKTNVTAGLIGLSSFLTPSKSMGQNQNVSNINSNGTELNTKQSNDFSVLSNKGFLDYVEKYKKQGVDVVPGQSAELFTKNNTDSITLTYAIGETQPAADMQAMKQANNPIKTFKMIKKLNDGKVLVIVFYKVQKNVQYTAQSDGS